MTKPIDYNFRPDNYSLDESNKATIAYFSYLFSPNHSFIVLINVKKIGKIYTYFISNFDIEFFNYHVESKASTLPLTLRELIKFVDSIRDTTVGLDLPGLTTAYWTVMNEAITEVSGGYSKKLFNFPYIKTDYYPQLSQHYKQVAKDFLTQLHV